MRARYARNWFGAERHRTAVGTRGAWLPRLRRLGAELQRLQVTLELLRYFSGYGTSGPYPG